MLKCLKKMFLIDTPKRIDRIPTNVIQIVHLDKHRGGIYLNGKKLNRVIDIKRKPVTDTMEDVTITLECARVDKITATKKDIEPVPLSEVTKLVEDGWLVYETTPDNADSDIKLFTFAKP